jgi:acyl-CoA thioesterase FadM
VNLYFRLLCLHLLSRLRTPCPLLGPCLTPFRVMPTDLDVLLHMNNGKYMSLLDLGRIDLLIRSGFLAALRGQGWYPVVAAEAIRFKRSLRLFQSFEIETRVIGWDHKVFALEQRFLHAGAEMASAVVWARILRRSGGGVAPNEVLANAGYSGPEIPLPEWASNWAEPHAIPR